MIQTRSYVCWSATLTFSLTMAASASVLQWDMTTTQLLSPCHFTLLTAKWKMPLWQLFILSSWVSC